MLSMKLKIQIIVVMIVLAIVTFFIWDYRSTKAENTRLKTELSTANNTIAQLDMKAEVEAEITKNKDKKIRIIRNVKKSDDGPVSNVLRSTIEQLQNDSK